MGIKIDTEVRIKKDSDSRSEEMEQTFGSIVLFQRGKVWSGLKLQSKEAEEEKHAYCERNVMLNWDYRNTIPHCSCI